DRIRNHRIDPDYRKKQTDAPEDREDHGEDTPLPFFPGEPFRQRHDVVHWHGVVDSLHGALQSRRQRTPAAGLRPRQNRHGACRLSLAVRDIHDRSERSAWIPILPDVRNHPYNRQWLSERCGLKAIPLSYHANVPAEGIFTGPVFIREKLV